MKVSNDPLQNAIDLALGRTGSARSILDGFNPQDVVGMKALYGNRHSELELFAKTTSAYEQVERATRAVSASAMLHGRAEPLLDPYHGLPTSLAQRIHQEITAAQEALFGVGRYGGDAARMAAEKGLLSFTSSSARWASGLLHHQDELQRLTGVRDARDFAKTLTTARAITEGVERLAPLGSLAGPLASSGAWAENTTLRDTMTKMSAFAGSLATTGPVSAATLASSHSLLGDWKTLPDLEPAYWRDPEVRVRRYRDADVDPGVIETNNDALIDVLVESGMVPGGRTRSGANVAVIQAGSVSVRVMGARARAGTYEAIDGFDTSLKAHIDMTLTEEVGPRWFVQHIDPKIVGATKERRQAALLAGEEAMPLIYYLDLGQLIDIVRDKRHWRFFEPTFLDAEVFSVNMRRLNTIRRPTMHGRKIDTIQILEAFVLVYQFNQAMARIGPLDAGWDDDI